MKISKRIFLFTCAQFLALIFFNTSRVAFSATYPDHPIRWIVPYPPGGTTDVVARSIAQNMSNILGQAILIENKPGAGGQIAINYVAKAPADGYTLLVSDASLATIQSLHKTLAFNPQTDLNAVSLFVTVPHVVIVNPTLKIGNLSDLITINKKTTEPLIFSSGGQGSPLHLAGELLKSTTGLNWLHVPYKGAGPAIFAVEANEAQIATPSLPSVLTQIQGKKIDALAIMDNKRSILLPLVPSVVELGYSKAIAIGWVGLHAPANVYPEIIKKLASAAKQALMDHNLQSRLQNQGASMALDFSPDAYTKFVESQTLLWSDVVKSAAIQID